jgi:hypothetical protein
MTYLRKVAQRGADAHQLLAAQEAPKVDKKRCDDAYAGLQGSAGDVPWDDPVRGTSTDWTAQIREFWVDSCVSGKPKPVPGTLSVPPTVPSTSSAP